MIGKIIYTINVVINSDNPFYYDNKMDELAAKYKGRVDGSGFGFGDRDYEVSFKLEKNALSFKNHMKRLKAVNKRELTCYLNYNNPRTNCCETMRIDI